MDRCTGRRVTTEIMIENALKSYMRTEPKAPILQFYTSPWKWLILPNFINIPVKKGFWKKNTVWKEENAVSSIFFISHNVFYPIADETRPFEKYLICRLRMLSIWTSRKGCRLLKKLTNPSRSRGDIRDKVSFSDELLVLFPAISTDRIWKP